MVYGVECYNGTFTKVRDRISVDMMATYEDISVTCSHLMFESFLAC